MMGVATMGSIIGWAVLVLGVLMLGVNVYAIVTLLVADGVDVPQMVVRAVMGLAGAAVAWIGYRHVRAMRA